MSFLINSRAYKYTTTKRLSPKTKPIKRIHLAKMPTNTPIFLEEFALTRENNIIPIYNTVSLEIK